ncbi:hypothetical protein WHI96_22285 [Pseudonocardia tropica]|uniref:Secreted protein n=1 Tax=Pseudonocardia tropica TaxID=681289 RepID=A0ABV1K2K7_9PSEU
MGPAAPALVAGRNARTAPGVGSCTAGSARGAGHYSDHTCLLFTAAVLSSSDRDAAGSLRSRSGRGTDRVWAAPSLVVPRQRRSEPALPSTVTRR